MISRKYFVLLILILMSLSGLVNGQTFRKAPYEEGPVAFYLVKNDPVEGRGVSTLTVDETIIPTMQPTFDREPSSLPSRRPNPSSVVFPTLNPSIEPTIEPTIEPSGTPVLHPTIEPTYAPTFTLPPTPAPTAESTAFPSTTLTPSVTPTFEPTADFSVVPSEAPTYSVTVPPTVQPTCEPSHANTTPLGVIRCSISNTTLLITQYMNRTSTTVGLMDSNFNYSTSRLVFVKQNLTVSLRNLNLNNFPVQISSYVAAAGCVSPYNDQIDFETSEAVCQDPWRVSMMWLSFMSNRPFSTICGNTRWTAAICKDSSYRACANCTSPCFAIAPSGGSSFRWASAVGFYLQPHHNPWPEWTQVSTPGIFEAKVKVNLTAPGTITCAAFPVDRVVTTATAVLVANGGASLKLEGDGTQNPPSFTGSLVISNLRPDRSYHIYCASSSLQQSAATQLGRTASISRIMQSVELIRTLSAPLPLVAVSLSDKTLITNKVSGAISVTLAFALSKNITLIPSLRYINSNLCSAMDVSNSSTFNSTGSMQIVPAQLYFGSFDTSSKSLYVKVFNVGCYNLTFFAQYNDEVFMAQTVLTSLSSVTGANIISSAVPQNILLNCTSVPVIPTVSLIRLLYDISGMDLMLTLSNNVDLGYLPEYILDFPCDKIVKFDGDSHASCRFSRPNSLRISIPASLDLLLPGEEVTLLDNVMKPVCPSTDPVFCDSVPFVSPQSIAVSYTNNVPVEVALSAPSMVMAGGNLTLDASTSIGNGGRAWTFDWEVAFNGSTSHPIAQSLMNVMNSGHMQWFGCVSQHLDCSTLSGSLLSIAGDYTFFLTLTNFLGNSNSISVTVTVIPDYFVPSVRIIGSSFDTLYVNTSINLRVFVDTSSFVCPIPLEIDWMTYVDDTANAVTLSRPNSDPRTLTLNANSLIPNHLYRFQVNVFCDSVFSFAYVERYILPIHLGSVFVSGLQSTISLTNSFALNGSLEYPLRMYGDPEDITYVWSCLQLQPFSTQGCEVFYSATNLSSPVLIFTQPKYVFSPDATYQIGLFISSASLGISYTAYQTIRTLSDMLENIPRISVDVPELYATTQFGYVINATVRGPSTFVSTWEIISTNQVLYSRVFVDGGADQLFPAVIPPSLLPSRFSYTFRLSAFAPTSSCFALACMDPSEVTSITFTTTVNRPPTSGSLDVSPRRGNEDTVFSAFAHNWQDGDLPIQYDFHQSTDNGITYRLIRQRMVLSFVQTKLVVFPTEDVNTTVHIRCNVYDVYSARTTVTTRVYYEFTRATWNASDLVAFATQATFEVRRQLAGEYVLSTMAGVADAIEKLNCNSLTTTTGDIDELVQAETADTNLLTDCVNLVTVGTSSLDESASYYNRGSALLLGIARYLQYLVSIDPQAVTPKILTSVLRLYNYINAAVAVVGVRDMGGNELVNTMLVTTDRLVVLLRAGKQGDNATDYVAPLSLAMTKLLVQYFSDMPFGAEQVFDASTYFDTSMNKNYFAQSSSLNNTEWTVAAAVSLLTPVTAVSTVSSPLSSSVVPSSASSTVKALSSSHTSASSSESADIVMDGIAFSGNIFPANKTTSYELLTVRDVLPVSSYPVQLPADMSDYEHISGATHMRFKVFAGSNENEITDDLTMTVFFAADTSMIQDLSLSQNGSSNTTMSTIPSSSSSVVNTARVVLYRNCSEADIVTNSLSNVQCSSRETGGPVYNFPPYECPSNTATNGSQIVAFTCPLYTPTIGCFRDGEWFANATWLNNTASVVEEDSRNGSSSFFACTYPILSVYDQLQRHRQRRLMQSMDGVSHNVVSVEGYFAIGRTSLLVKPALTTLLTGSPVTPNPPGVDTSIASNRPNSVNYIAIVSIAIAGILFAAFLYFKLKHFVANNPAEVTYVPTTQAVLAPQYPLTTAEILPPHFTDIYHCEDQETGSAVAVAAATEVSATAVSVAPLTQQNMVRLFRSQLGGTTDSNNSYSDRNRHRTNSHHSSISNNTSGSTTHSDSRSAAGRRPPATGSRLSLSLPLPMPLPARGVAHRPRMLVSSSSTSTPHHLQHPQRRSSNYSDTNGYVVATSSSSSSSSDENMDIESSSRLSDSNDSTNTNTSSENHDSNNSNSNHNNHGSQQQLLLSPSGVDMSTVPFIGSADVEMIHIDAVAFPYLRI